MARKKDDNLVKINNNPYKVQDKQEILDILQEKLKKVDYVLSYIIYINGMEKQRTSKRCSIQELFNNIKMLKIDNTCTEFKLYLSYKIKNLEMPQIKYYTFNKI